MCDYGAALFILVWAYAIADDVPIAIWAYDDTCEVLLINQNIFLCLCYFGFFGWPYVNGNDAANRYPFLKYMMWFLLTWTGCPRGNPSCFAALNKSIWSRLSLFCGFLFVIASEVFLYVKPDNIYMPLLFCIFSPHMSVAMLLHTNIFFSTIPCENMQSWLPPFVFYDLFILISSESFSDVFMDIAFYTSAAVGVSSGWPH